jgi:hypothetical protein
MALNTKVKVSIYIFTGLLLFALHYFFGSGHGDFSNKYFSVETNYRRGLTIIRLNKDAFAYSVDNSDHKADFYMNANFFDTLGNPIGLVKINGKIINSKVDGGGFFHADSKGNPNINPYQANYTNSVQTKYYGIMNGKIKDHKGKLDSSKFYRSLLGINDNGDIVIIHTTRWGIISMNEISEYGKKKGLKNALIFDGGTSIDIGIKTPEKNYSFKSTANWLKPLLGIQKPKVYIVGNIKLK